MHTDAHHLWCFCALGVQRVKTVTQIGKEVFALAKSLGQRKAHVVAVHGVGHDELRHDFATGFFDLHPKRQVVTVIVAVVFKATMVSDQSMGIGTVAAGIPTSAMDRVAVRGLGYARKDLDAFLHVRTFGGLVDGLVIDPAPAMASDFMAQVDECLRDFWMAFQRHADAKHSEWQLTFFEFTQDTFDLLCLDLSRYPISRAVAASSSVPAVLTPITIRNSAGRCGYRVPNWTLRAIESGDHSSREHFRAATMLARSDSRTYGYLHLMDGALSDNLGVRSILDALTDGDDALHFQNALQRSGIRKLVFITLNASDTQWARIAGRRSPPDVLDMLKLVGTVPMDRYSVESKALLKETLARWVGRLSPESAGTALYFIDLSLDSLRDNPRFKAVTQIETTFSLKRSQVDELRCAAKLLLSGDPEYQRLLSSQGGGVTAPAACSW